MIYFIKPIIYIWLSKQICKNDLKDYFYYEYNEIKTDRSYYIFNHDIEILSITSKYYLNSKSLVFELYNFQSPK